MKSTRKRKTPEVYLSKKDIKVFFKIPSSDIDYLTKRKILTPSISGGQILFSLTDILEALTYLLNKHKE